MQLQQTIEETVKPIAEAAGLEFIGVECEFSSKIPIVRIYINGENGVSVDDCAKISRQVSSAMDVEIDSLGRYNLEVSSPGAERRLFTVEQCCQQIGKIVKITLAVPRDGRQNFKGKLLAVDGEQLLVDVESAQGKEELKFCFSEVKRAKTVLQYS